MPGWIVARQRRGEIYPRDKFVAKGIEQRTGQILATGEAGYMIMRDLGVEALAFWAIDERHLAKSEE